MRRHGGSKDGDHDPVSAVPGEAEETMPTDGCVFFWERPACRAMVKTRGGLSRVLFLRGRLVPTQAADLERMPKEPTKLRHNPGQLDLLRESAQVPHSVRPVKSLHMTLPPSQRQPMASSDLGVVGEARRPIRGRAREQAPADGQSA